MMNSPIYILDFRRRLSDFKLGERGEKEKANNLFILRSKEVVIEYIIDSSKIIADP